MAKVRKFEDGLKLTIRGKIVGFLLPYMDSMVRTTMTTERDIDDARSIRDGGASEKKRENQCSSSSGKHEDFMGRAEPRLSRLRPSRGI